MKYAILVATLFLFTFLACNISDKKGKLLSVDNLPSKKYSININRDTTLETENGALLKIPKGALKPSNGNNVTLEIREAYSMQQIIQAGLTTQSNGEPLSSGGMIYINAVEGQNVSFIQPIKVAIPADYLQKGMQLFKGELSNRKLDWTNPTALSQNRQLTSIENGKILFQNNCASCHAIGRDLTGPNLAHFPKRFDAHTFGAEGLPYDWYHGYFRYAESLPVDSMPKKGGDQFYSADEYDYGNLQDYFCNLLHIYASRGVHFNFNRDEWYAVYNYIQNESESRNLPLPGHAYLKDCVDSCRLYKEKTRELRELKNLSELKRNKLIKDNGRLVNVTADTTWPVNNNPPPLNFDKKVSPNNYDAIYYQFSVESFGWFNIDMMLNNVEGVEESELFVKAIGDYKEKVETFLIIPSVKTYAQGGPADRNSEEFAFYYKNGKIPLPQNVEAYILAVTETENSIAYGLKKFTTSKQQEIQISLHASSKEEFMEAMKGFEAERLHIKVADTKNSNEIRKTDTTLQKIDDQLKVAENLKPKKCDCNCGEYPQ